ncbi:MAG: acyltransferase [Sphingopyxis sp.]|uniref:acyltransferase family protein n=1 Tax=Sphingopyxis sp. TaxID=1908224 RepID=UPI002ABB26C2|nr:acyltransferase [Sphingopyxis sp.]MDZ3833691.1 acyltransferase [Sphingopyxis sp.]
MIITDDRLRATANNLTLVRLVLASAVIWSHSYWRILGIANRDELSPWLGTTISAYAVDGFFFLSGFLVYRSLSLRGSVLDFFVARLARLWPGLAAAVALTILGGYFLSAFPAGAYFKGDTLSFAIKNLSLLAAHYNLTGLQCGAEPCVVNGSLWTIPWEVRCYALLGLLALAGLASPRWMARLILPLTAAGALGLHVPGMATLVDMIGGKGVLYNIQLIDRLWTMFALGIAAYLWRDRLRLSWTMLLLLGALNLAAQHWHIHIHIQSLFVGYMVLCFGFLSARRGAISGSWPDYSYGMYIYAFPVMMLLASAFTFHHHGWLALANAAATLPLAALSWHLVERPVLDRVRRRNRPKSTVTAQAKS